jgi:cbb3-type cytochrome oxidase maturation protein
MTVIYVLIALSLSVALGFLAAFLWAVRSGQYDDTHTPSMRVLFEETKKTSQTSQPVRSSQTVETVQVSNKENRAKPGRTHG